MEHIEINERTNELRKELEKNCIEIREDSNLCKCYINNTLGSEWNIEKVVTECCTMKWLFLYTDYPLRCHHAREYFYYHFPYAINLKEYIRDNVKPYIKKTVIEEFGGIPETWPWIVQDVKIKT